MIIQVRWAAPATYSRGAAAHISDAQYESHKLRVIGPVDPNDPKVKANPELMASLKARLKEESPDAYKPILPVIDTICDAGIASRVATLSPILTVKG